jgi:carbonic anhydrase
MEKLVQGIHQFQTSYFCSEQELFKRLAGGQSPMALFITCSDSRISPSLLMQAKPGDLFCLRNAGNIVPPYGASRGGEEATIEYAIRALNVEHVIVCGHSHCGAMKALLNPHEVEDMPAVTNWLSHAEATRRIIKENYAHLDKVAKLKAAIEENVLVQLENIRTHPSVAARLAKQEISLHGWYYKIETGQVFSFDPGEGQFISLTQNQITDNYDSDVLRLSVAGD